jgi:hypothetical protein
MPEQPEHVEVTAVKPHAGAIEQIERATIDLQIATAHKYPKHTSEAQIKVFKKKLLEMATMDEKTAADCFYVLPRANKTIDGPSIRLAEMAISTYGNIRDSVRTVAVEPRGLDPHVVVQAVCHDLENNVALSIEKRRRITKKKKKPFPDEDDINLAVNNAASIGLRDAAFRVIPRAYINQIVNACKRVAIGDARSIIAKRDTCIERLNKMGVTNDRILDVLECEAIEDIGLDHLEVLIGLGTAMKDGACTLDEAFPAPQAEQTGAKAADRIKDQAKKEKEPPKGTGKKPAGKKKAAAKDKAKDKGTEAPEPDATEPPPEDPEPTQEEQEAEPPDEALEPDAPEQVKYQCERCLTKLPASKVHDNKCTLCLGGVKEI